MLPFCERVVSKPRKKLQPVWRRSFPASKEPRTLGEHLRRRRHTLGLHQSQAAQKLGVSSRALTDWECDKTYTSWGCHERLIEYLGYDPFPSCGLQDPYGNEPQGVAVLPSDTIGKRLRQRRLELKLTRSQFAQKLGVPLTSLRGWERGGRVRCRKHQALLRAELDPA
jgi:transcriptional regulator with XRE-family HTH domain